MDKIIQGDCLEELKALPNNSVDLVCTDPPYGYSFMGKNWDKAVPSVEVWKECLRVLKPGAFAFVMSAPRQDVLSQMIVRIGEAGFDTSFTSIYWTYASGFPKAMNVGKRGGPTGSYGGFQPKPAVEVIIVAMKPLSEKTFVDQALKNGKGVTWLDDCRVPTNPDVDDPRLGGKGDWSTTKAAENIYEGGYAGERVSSDARGRFPANLLVSDDVLVDHSRYFDLDAWAKTFPFLITPKASKGEKNAGLEEFADSKNVPRSGLGARRCTNCEGWEDDANHTKCECDEPDLQAIERTTKNHHPTVKPLKLMAYLITLGTRPGDVVLDPFLGSGTTALAAKNLNRRYIGIEREAEYVEIAKARLLTLQPTLMEAAE